MTSFEYVLGTLTESERSEFERALAADQNLQKEVKFWEAHLMTLHSEQQNLPVGPDTWKNIAQKIGIDEAVATAATENTDRVATVKPVGHWLSSKSLQWLIPFAASLLFAVGISLFPKFNTPVPNADYVAVLTAANGAAKLTALTASDGQTLWLQWQDVAIESNVSIQLWAVSKRDGQIRSLAVFDSTTASSLILDQANLRLIKDAEKLILTQEEPGGSALDEPSENVIASGVCVRLTLNSEKRG